MISTVSKKSQYTTDIKDETTTDYKYLEYSQENKLQIISKGKKDRFDLIQAKKITNLSDEELLSINWLENWIERCKPSF